MAYKDQEKYKEYQKKWRENNKEKIREYNQTKGKESHKRWYEKNKERVKMERKENYPNIKEKENLRSKKYHENNRGKILLRKKEYFQKPEVKKIVNERQKKYRLKHLKKNKERDKTKHDFPLKGKWCKFCNEKAQEHHHYTEPYQFDKFWFVCRKHHLEIHKGGQDAFLEG